MSQETPISEITLDGKTVSFGEGETLYEISQRQGTEIPTLCYDDRLEAFGGCRLCIVEVEGMRNPVASCTTRAAPGMIVHTRTEAVEKHRKTLMELVVSENPAGTNIDPLRGLASQEMGSLVAQYQVSGQRFAGKQSGISNTSDDNPFILRDYDHCISCYRCVRVCAEQEGDYAISVMNRGFATQITTEFNGLLAESACTFCGQCIQTCPTGALADKKAMRAESLPGAHRDHSLGVPLLWRWLLGRSHDQGRYAGRHPAGHGRPGQRGRFVRQGPIRLRLRPASRPARNPTGCATTPASWFRSAGTRLSIAPRPDFARRATSTAATASTPWPRAARRTRARTRCRNGSEPGLAPTMSITVAVLDTLQRSPVWRPRSDAGAMSNPLRDMEKPDVIFCIGTNMTECHPVAATRIKKAVQRGAKLIVADPRKITLAEMADVYLQLIRRHRFGRCSRAWPT